MNVLRLIVVRHGHRPDDVTRPAVDAAKYGDLELDDYDGEDADEEDAESLKGQRELLVVINGVSEFDRWDGLGLDPDDLLDPDSLLIPPTDGNPVDRIVQRCSCGDVGCGSLTVTIRRLGDAIEWNSFRENDRPFPIGPFQFETGQYEQEIHRAHHERPWESRTERVARLVGEAFRNLRDQRPRSFDWVSGLREDGQVVVSFSERRPNPQAGKPVGQRRYAPGGGYWQGLQLPELVEQYVGKFAIPDDEDDVTAVAEIVRQIRETDPRSWPRPYA